MIPDIHVLTGVVRESAKAELLPRFARAERRFKGDGSVVTCADLAVQSRLAAALATLTPAIPLLAEEMTEAEQAALLSDRGGTFWCLDPLDGTNNFAAGIPFFAVSLALIVEGALFLGIVYDPSRDECFWARRGQGAWLDGQPLRPAGDDLPLRRCIAIIDFKRLGAWAGRFVDSPPYGSQRSFGSVALEWCWLAAGRCQLYVHGRQALWDYAAGLLVLEEADGRATTLDGESVFTPKLVPRSVLAASNPRLFEEGRHWLEMLGCC